MIIEFDAFRYDTGSRALLRGNEEVALSPRVLAVLEVLLERPGEIVGKDEILARVWEGAYVAEDSLTQAISQLRGALGDDAQHPTYIQTVPRRGYRWVGEVSEPLESRRSAAVSARAWTPDRRSVSAVGVVVLVIAVLGAWALLLSRDGVTPANQVVRFDVSVPAGHTLAVWGVAASPHGRYFAFVTRDENGVVSASLKEAAVAEPRPLPGTEGVSTIAFSPDEQQLAFIRGQSLSTVSVLGGEPKDIVELGGSGLGLDWATDDSIFVAVEGVGLVRVSVDSPVTLTVVARPDPTAGEIDFQSPDVLPGGEAVLLDVYTSAAVDSSPVILYDLDSHSRTQVAGSGARPRYVDEWVIFVRKNTLFGVRFDPARGTTRGGEVPLLEGVHMSSTTGTAAFDVSQTGHLAYVAADPSATERRLLRLDATGSDITPISPDLRRFRDPSVSPDGRRIAVADEDGMLWIYDVDRASGPRNFTSVGVNSQPVWTPGGDRLTFSSNRDGPINIYSQAIQDGAEAERLTSSDNAQYPHSWSPDGRILAFVEARPGTGYDILLWDSRGDTVEELVATDAAEDVPMISPDGNWLAYQSDAAGARHVYLRRFSAPGLSHVVSDHSGSQPVWSSEGRLFFRSPGTQSFWSVDLTGVAVDGDVALPTPTLMFTGNYHSTWTRSWDVFPAGEDFVVVEDEQLSFTETTVHFALNWFAERKSLLRQER